MSLSAVDAALDSYEGDEACGLTVLLDRCGAWDEYSDGSERYAVVESSGAWWAVRASEGSCCDSRRCASESEARSWLARWMS